MERKSAVLISCIIFSAVWAQAESMPLANADKASEQAKPPAQAQSPASETLTNADKKAPEPSKMAVEVKQETGVALNDAKKAEPPAAPAVKKEAPPAAKSVGCVAPLQELIQHYQKEADSVQKMSDRWNAKMQSLLDRQKDLQTQRDALDKEISGKENSDDKAERKEVGRLKRQMARLDKDSSDLSREMQEQCRELAAEIKEVGRDSQAALKDKFLQVQTEILGTER